MYPCNPFTNGGPFLPYELQHVEQQETMFPGICMMLRAGEINGLFHPYRKDPILFKVYR